MMCKRSLPRQGKARKVNLPKNNLTFFEINLCTDFTCQNRLACPDGMIPDGCRKGGL